MSAAKPLPALALNWAAPEGGGGGRQGKPSCECTNKCGDDERLARGAVEPCEIERKTRALRVTLANTTAALEALKREFDRASAVAQALVDLLDRMEPDVPEDLRASDEEWIALKAWAKKELASGLAAMNGEVKTEASGLAAEGIEAGTAATSKAGGPR